MNSPNTDFIPQPVTKTQGFNYAALAARVFVVALLSCSLGLIYWSYYKVFYPYLKQARELTRTVAQLNSDLNDLNHQFTSEAIVDINAKVSVLGTNIFADPNELQTWLADLREQSQPLGMDVKTDYASSVAQTDAAPRFLILPATVTVQFQPYAGTSKGPTPYEKLVQLAQTITTRDKMDCLNELTVESGPNSIEKATMNFRFWVGTNDSK